MTITEAMPILKEIANYYGLKLYIARELKFARALAANKYHNEP